MSGECERCGEHTLECRCVDESISTDIQMELSPIYEKYKDNPNELVDALEWFIEIANETKEVELVIDDLYFPYLQSIPEKKDVEIDPGYICRLCAITLNGIPIQDHVCTWHRGICDFCHEEANLCHTSDWSWPDMIHLEEGREF